MKKLSRVFLIAAIMILAICVAASAANVWQVDTNGNITLNGTIFRVKGGSWFGLEGRYELASDASNPRGAPMEMYMGNVFWASSSRTYDTDAAEIKNLGFNTIRLPLVPQTLDDNDSQGKDPVLKNTSSVRIQGAFTALKTVIKSCSMAGLYVLLDIHSCSNYVGWRKGRLDARPPWADATRDNYDFKREDCSCSASGNPSTVTRIQAYDTTKWLANLKTLAGLGASISVDNIMGIDIFNEPWDYTWTEWKSLIDQAYGAVNSVNPNILIIAQGVGGKSAYGTVNPNWGENLYEAGTNPPTMPKSKLVFSPHVYGPSVCTQGMFADLAAQPQCAGLQEEAFGDAKCQIVINPTKLEVGWQEHFGYLKAMGYAVCIGEFGGNMDWPNKAEARHQTRYSYLIDKTTDLQWQNAFVNYLLKVGITDSIYWSINPESSDTYGVYATSYDPISNTGAWGTWTGTDSRKMTLLSSLWNAAQPSTGPTAVPTQAPTAVPTGIPTNVPTAAPTSVPTAAPTAVSTGVPTAAPTTIPTAVPTAVPTAIPTAVPTNPPTTGCTCIGGCSATISVTSPFTKDGIGEFCFVAACLSTINSWNLDSLNINGTSYTNLYSTSFPAPINGQYYIYYKSSVSFGHFEATGTCSGAAAPTAVPTAIPTTIPTAVPTSIPTAGPTAVPTAVSTAIPTTVPTAVPTAVPTVAPTAAPTTVPTAAPTAVPTAAPTTPPGSCTTITGAGNQTIGTGATCFTYAVAAPAHGALWSIMCGGDISVQLNWYGKTTENGTCAAQQATVNANNQLNNFVVEKNASGIATLTVTKISGTGSTVSFNNLQTTQNGTVCVAP